MESDTGDRGNSREDAKSNSLSPGNGGVTGGNGRKCNSTIKCFSTIISPSRETGGGELAMANGAIHGRGVAAVDEKDEVDEK